jgi:cysteine desulfurase
MIYLDNNATTRVDPLAFEAMRPFLTEQWGNPSSGYAFGKAVGPALTRAREQAAALIGADPAEIVFTACGTESINTAIGSAVRSAPAKKHLITTSAEHSATLKVCRAYESRGYELTLLPVDSAGLVELDAVAIALREDTAIVSVLWANNETGVLAPIGEIAALCRSRGILFHTDAVQLPGKLPINVREAPVDFLSISGHKFRAPKGVGFLYVREGTAFHPMVLGGGQERGRRGGTENMAGIVGLGCAAELAVRRLTETQTRVRAYRDRLEQALLDHIPGTQVNGSREHRIPNTSNLRFEGIDGEVLMLALDTAGICVSTGSACATGSLQPSHVLTAMGLSPVEARGSIRFSWGWDNTESEGDRVLEAVRQAVARIRAETLPLRI